MMDCENFFKALSDESRQRILKMVEKEPMRVSDIAAHFDFSQPTISHHLDILKRAGLINSRRDGQNIYYSLNAEWFTACCSDFLSMFKCCEELIQPQIGSKNRTRGKN